MVVGAIVAAVIGAGVIVAAEAVLVLLRSEVVTTGRGGSGASENSALSSKQDTRESAPYRNSLTTLLAKERMK